MTANTVNVEEQIYTHEYLWRTSTYLTSRAEEQGADYRQFIPALLMTFLAYEAFLNFLGHVLAPELWAGERNNFKGKGLEGKLEAIVRTLPSFQWQKGSMPYQAVKALEQYRDMVSHGKVVASNYQAERREDGSHFRFDHPWDEYLSLSAVQQARENVMRFSSALLESARKVSDEPHLVFGAYQGSLGRGSSGGSQETPSN